MAIFKKKKAEKPAGEKGEVKKSEKILSAIVRPRITEKAAHRAGDKVYTFTVLPSATKREIALAVSAAYGVTAVSVNTAPVRSKVRRRGKFVGQTNTMKKAYVRLKDGETIEFV